MTTSEYNLRSRFVSHAPKFHLHLRNFKEGCGSDVFWEIMDDLVEEYAQNDEGFWGNRSVILEHFAKGCMYTIDDWSLDDRYFPEMEHMKPRNTGPCYGASTVPGFVCYDPTDVDATILWIRKDYRRHGYASFLINKLNIKEASVLRSSVKFWTKNGFRESDCRAGRLIKMKRENESTHKRKLIEIQTDEAESIETIDTSLQTTASCQSELAKTT